MKGNFSGRYIMKQLFIILLIIATVPMNAGYRPYTEVSIQWDKGIVTARSSDSFEADVRLKKKGSGSINRLRLLSYSRAQKNTKELLASFLLGIPVEQGYTLEHLLDDSEYTREKISFMINNSVAFRQYPDGFYKAQCHASLTFKDIISTLPFRYHNENFPVYTEHGQSTLYTSLIIDTRGTDFTPQLFPAILDEGGLEIYNRHKVNIASCGSSGIVNYVYDEESAISHKIAGKHPYFTIALKTVDNKPVIGYKDVRRIFSNLKNSEYLKRCRVILIIDDL